MGRPWPTLGRSATEKKPFNDKEKAQYGKQYSYEKF
jgi:hypothetical protein